MLIDTLNERIIDMKTVHEMETASADTKKQAMADYNFKQLILNLKQMVDEVNLAVENSDFRPSANVISALKSFLGVCEKVVQTGVANNATTQYISFESKKLYTVIGQEWSEFYLKATANILSLLDTVKGIIPDENKAIYATNKIKKASSWNVTIDNYNYLKQGIAEADKILEDLDLDEDSEILAFLKLVSEGKATILNLTDEILAWIKAENLADKMSGAVFDCSGMVLLLVARGLGAGVFLFRFANGEWQYRGELEPIPHQGVITKRLQKILLRDNRLIFVYNSRIRKYDVETGKLVYNKAVRHAFETEGEDLTQKFKGIYRTGFY